MRLPQWLRRRGKLPPPPPAGGCPRQRLAEAEQRRGEAYRRWPAVEALAARLDNEHHRNHFGETIDTIYRRRHA
ncbi:DUF7620 family protein [Dietzia aurantiaca]|uniref:DUF7620 family protein n=1 Tax=Dietzia aurantiaca TaxID=983873 RepID=UPI003FD6DC58